MRQKRVSQKTADQLKDEVYRHMLRLDAGRPAAQFLLALALLNAWMTLEEQPSDSEPRQWLRKVCPFCLRMIQATFDSASPCRRHGRDHEEKKTTMNVHVKQLDGVRFAIGSRSHTIISDQPADNGGADSGMTPPELLLTSLGSCAAYYALQYPKTRKLADSGVEVSVTAEKLKAPPRLGTFQIGVICPVSLTEDQQQAMLRVVHQCIVHNTLQSQPEIAIRLQMPKEEAAH